MTLQRKKKLSMDLVLDDKLKRGTQYFAIFDRKNKPRGVQAEDFIARLGAVMARQEAGLALSSPTSKTKTGQPTPIKQNTTAELGETTVVITTEHSSKYRQSLHPNNHEVLKEANKSPRKCNPCESGGIASEGRRRRTVKLVATKRDTHHQPPLSVGCRPPT